MRPQEQVEMTGHQTIRCQPHRHLVVSLPNQTHKRRKVVIRVGDVTSTIAPVQDMINKRTSRCS